MTTVILQGPRLTDESAAELAKLLGGRVERRGDHMRLVTDRVPDRDALADLRARYPFDINPVPARFDPGAARLLISDMDSTLINIECADEIADLIGIKPEVAAITSAAMRGDIDFETSLTRRLALLKGVGVDALDRVYTERLRPNEGAEALLAGLRERGIRTALVSGGFTFFTERLRTRLGLDFTLANELVLEDGRLTGTVRGAVVGAEAKAGFLLELCDELEIHPHRAITVGDGANDLPMMRLSGLGVAFRAKPAVQAEADVVIRHCGLDAILAFLA